MDAEIEKLLPLAKRIARDFSNIPGLPLKENLKSQGFGALDSRGLLKSFRVDEVIKN